MENLNAIPVGLMAAVAAVMLVIPVILFFFFKKKGADVLPFFVGCAVFIVFAYLIEAMINYAVGQSSFGKRMNENALLLAVYGGLMAGVFEETGRFIAFKTVLKKYRGNDLNALQYGAGHGGMEAVLTVTLSYITYISLISFAKSGSLETMLAGEDPSSVYAVFDELAGMSNWMYLVVILERCLAIAAHIALSVPVWFAAKKRGKLWLFPLAILLHAVLDGVIVLCAKQFMLPTLAVEGVNAAITAVIIIIAVCVWKRNREMEIE